MLTTSPLPRWTDFSCALSGPEPDDLELARPWRRGTETPFWLSGGAWSMKAIALWWQRCHGQDAPSLWLPDFFCNESTQPLRETAARLTFYPIDSNLEPRWEHCRRLSAQQPPDLFIIVHYFGLPADSAAALEFCRESGALLVEDGAHALQPAAGIGEFGDFVFYSPHKPLPVPEGSVLLARDPSHATDMAQAVQDLGPAVARVGKWLTKRAIQRTPLLRWMWRMRQAATADAPYSYGTLDQTPGLSRIARRMLARASRDLPAAARARRRTYEQLSDYARDSAFLPDAFREPGFDAAPFKFVLPCQDPTSADDLCKRLRAQRCPVQRWPEKSGWPDLPPEVLADTTGHAEAISLQRRLLLLPVHPNVDAKAVISRISAC